MRAKLIVAAAVLAVGFAAAPVRGSEPSEGNLSSSEPVTWTGGPFPLSHPVPCAVELALLCDSFTLHVEAPGGTQIQIAIVADDPADDLDLQVFSSDGTLAAIRSSSSGSERVEVIHVPSHSPYSVRVQPVAVGYKSTYRGLAALGPHLNDPEQDCFEYVPHTAGVRGVTDDGAEIELAVRVLVDSGPEGAEAAMVEAQRAFATATASYAPLGIRLTATFEAVQFTSGTPFGILREAKDHFGGARPPGTDVVYTVVARTFGFVAGLADCIGGVEYADRAFAMGGISGAFTFGPFVFQRDATAKIAAHEIGHLLGAHHHYMTCTEQVKNLAEPTEFEPCELMGPDLAMISLDFGV